MRVGTLCFATESGLGILAKSFYDHGVVTDAMVVRHGRHITHDHWYPGSEQVSNINSDGEYRRIVDFASNCDVMLFFETPFVWRLIDDCRRMRVKTALMVMHECLHQQVWQHKPDLFLCPSLLDLEVIDKSYAGCMQMFLPVPVEYPWRQRERARVFVHNTGHGGLKGRNGTKELMEVIQYVQSPIGLIVRSQELIDPRLTVNIRARETFGASERIGPRVDLRNEQCDYATLFDEGDVFIFPECFNGLSLPLQEARAAGMLVMCGDRFPMNRWLPCEPLIPVQGYAKERIGPPYNEYDRAIFDPRTIAATIDAWFDKDISEYSCQGREWAAQNSWSVLKPRYIDALQNLL